jgi:hypothetical protein
MPVPSAVNMLWSANTLTDPPERRASRPAAQLSRRRESRTVTLLPSADGSTSTPAPGNPWTVTSSTRRL